jgi:hypothetical protein
MPGLYEQLESHLGDDDESKKHDSKAVYEQLEPHLDATTGHEMVFERATRQLEPVGKITPAHLLGIAPDRKQVLLFLLRNPEANLQGVTFETLADALPALADSLPNLILTLAKEGWLIVMGEHPNLRYRINLSRRPGTDLGFGIWSQLTHHLSDKTGD